MIIHASVILYLTFHVDDVGYHKEARIPSFILFVLIPKSCQGEIL